MAVRLRLQRLGKPKKPVYRVVAMHSRDRRNGRPIEVLGQYDPMAKEQKMKVSEERLGYWLKQGASPSETISALIKKEYPNSL